MSIYIYVYTYVYIYKYVSIVLYTSALDGSGDPVLLEVSSGVASGVRIHSRLLLLVGP